MAAPDRNRSKRDDPLFEKTREKIKLTQLITRLNNNALGTLTKNSGKEKPADYEEEYIEMSQGQIASAKILLDKSLPSLQSVEVAGPDGDPIEIRYSKLTDEALDARLAELNEDS